MFLVNKIRFINAFIIGRKKTLLVAVVLCCLVDGVSIFSQEKSQPGSEYLKEITDYSLSQYVHFIDENALFILTGDGEGYIKKEEVAILQDFKEYREQQQHEYYEGFTRSDISPVINGKVCCLGNWKVLHPTFGYIDGGDRANFSVDVESGDWDNLTDDHVIGTDLDDFFNSVD